MEGNPQKEEGMTPIASELLEALLRPKFNGYEFKILLAIIRKTYGWKKKNDYISLSQFEVITGIKKPHISRTLKHLLQANIVTKLGNKIGINKMYNTWKELPNQVTVTKLGNTVTKLGNKKLPNQAPQKVKGNNTKAYIVLFNFWNYKRIIKHSKLTDKMIISVRKALMERTLPEIFYAVGKYGTVLNNLGYFWTHRWTLDEFLVRGLTKFIDTPLQEFFINKPPQATAPLIPTVTAKPLYPLTPTT